MYRNPAELAITRWEYRTVVGPDVATHSAKYVEQLDERLNELGAQGWEAVSTSISAARMLVLLKRQLFA